jgi:hypothetical protein
MDSLTQGGHANMMGGGQSGGAGGVKAFVQHVFSASDEHTADMLNNVQYALMGAVPVLLLNKAIQRFVPDIDPDKSAVEITIEVIFQILAMIIGVILIHRAITFAPTYSGVKHDVMSLSGSILLFLVVMLSVQTKLGAKMNILWDRAEVMWEGTADPKGGARTGLRKHAGYRESMTGGDAHSRSRSDADDDAPGGFIHPPQPSGAAGFRNQEPMIQSVAPANALLGSSFGSY